MKFLRVSVRTTTTTTSLLAFLGAEACFEDARMCPDGTVLVRDPNNNCEFPPCNDEGCSNEDFRVCAENKMILLPDPLNNCEIPSCPLVVQDIPCGWLEFSGELLCYNFERLGAYLPEMVGDPWLDNGCGDDGIHTRVFCGVSANGTCEKQQVKEPCFVDDDDDEPLLDNALEPAPIFSGAFAEKSMGRILATAGVTGWFLLVGMMAN